MAARCGLRWQLLSRSPGLRPVPTFAVRLRNTRISYSGQPGNDAVRFAYRPTFEAGAR
jgi:hypothetical protein